jgi:transposase
MSTVIPAGIEISAKTLHVGLRLDGHVEKREFPNTAAGHRKIRTFLRRRGAVVRVCMEATGVYGLDLALALEGAPGLELMVANPRSVHDFARARMQRSKDDDLDLDLLIDYAARMPFRPWLRPSAAALQLRSLMRTVRGLVNDRTAAKNRLHAVTACTALSPVCQRELQRLIEAQGCAIARLEAEAQRLVAADPALAQRAALLITIRGIGPRTALALLGELAGLPDDLDRRQLVAHAGLDPRHVRSGTSVELKPRISKVGNRRLREALFLPALVAIQREPRTRAFYDALLQRGKAPRQAQVAVMRKLLHAVWGVLHYLTPFDPARLFPDRQPAR